MEKVIIFDASTLISFSMNGLLDQVEKLKQIFKGKFIITEEVKYEIIDRPIDVKRFELEALRLQKLFNNKVLELPSSLGIETVKISSKKKEIEKIANSMFVGRKGEISLIHDGETSCLALSRILLDKKIPHVIAIDERTTRMLSEKPENLKELIERKMNTKVRLQKKDFKYFEGFRFIRSCDLIYVAWKKQLTDLAYNKKTLDALLYALKFKGCSISNEEIKEIKGLK